MPEQRLSTTSGRTPAARALRARAGFTLIEFVVAVTLFAALSAVVIPAAVVQLKKGEVTSVMRQLDQLATGMGAFRDDTGVWPTTVEQLVLEPGSDGSSGPVSDDGWHEDNSGNNKKVKHWKGPYLNVGWVPATGINTSLNGTISSTLGTTCTNGHHWITIQVTGIVSKDAETISLKKDGDSDLDAGLVRWTQTAGPEDPGMLEYFVSSLSPWKKGC